ncbi:tyrosine-type recombinase/integrase [Paenibacillus hodogayensis]|uniref:Tyrosine-type recombinase/integrase n=1 Tax=Paenibacillus hodogayensis TaxID=279208 RepID=A0ABV5W5N6_9BACL
MGKSSSVLVNGIHWEKDRIANIFAWEEEVNGIFQLPIPAIGKEIYFSEDEWDFSELDQLNRPQHLLKFDFTKLTVVIKNAAKLLIFKSVVLHKLEFSTIYSKMNHLNFISKFLSESHIFRPELITNDVIDKFKACLNQKWTEATRIQYYTTFIDLLKQLERLNKRLEYSEQCNALKKADMSLYLAEREDGKTDEIPRVFFNQLIVQAMQIINDSNSPENEQIQACIIMLLSQTGMRVGELVKLECDKKETISILEGTKQVSYLEYKTFKTIQSDEYKWTKTILTDKAEKAYDLLVYLKKKRRDNSNYLLEAGTYSAPATWVRRNILRFVARYKTTIDCINLTETRLNKLFVQETKNRMDYYLNNSYLEGLNPTDTIHFPLPHQFRVTLATILYEQGVHIDWIREHMNHLSHEMTLHYIREHEKRKNKEKLIKKTIEELVATDSDSKSIHRKIDRFINEGKYHISIDIQSLIDEVQGEVPIREKEQGFCIKSNYGRKCPKNEYLDIPEVQHHIVSFEYIDITYNRYLSIRSTIEYNQKNGYLVESSREEKKLYRLITHYFIPELNELNEDIKYTGEERTRQDYPHLVEIINNRNQIYDEVAKWISPMK